MRDADGSPRALSSLAELSARGKLALQVRYPTVAMVAARMKRGLHRLTGTGPLPLPLELDRLRRQVDAIVGRLHAGRLLSSDLIAKRSVILDGTPAETERAIRNRTIHEPDYAVFSKLERSLGTVLDIGANCGYSVASLRALGCSSPILSFEVLPGYRDCLERVRKLLGSDYDFVLCGLGEAPQRLTFYTPTINRQALTALTSANPEGFAEQYAEHIVNYAREHMKDGSPYTFQFLAQEAEIDTLDQILSRIKTTVPVDRIAAMKIDVEGLEGAVLRGARATLLRDRPLLMTESGDRVENVRELTTELGYLSAERVPGCAQLERSVSECQGANGFFYHPVHLTTYLRLGLLRS